jgi:hypothetical protein
MNLQRLIEQHPAAPAAIMPILFVCLWLFVSATISVIGGWFSLAKVYRAQGAFDGNQMDWAEWRNAAASELQQSLDDWSRSAGMGKLFTKTAMFEG